MPKYAANTEVPVSRSREEIQKTLERYGATAFSQGWDQTRAFIAFQAGGRMVRFILPLPDRADPAFTHQKVRTWEQRTPESAAQLWEQSCRQRWRALALAVKAKLEVVDAGISTFENEFMAHIVLPDGTTVAEFLGPQLAEAYATGRMPRSLALLGPGLGPEEAR